MTTQPFECSWVGFQLFVSRELPFASSISHQRHECLGRLRSDMDVTLEAENDNCLSPCNTVSTHILEDVCYHIHSPSITKHPVTLCV
jgi:hypothetical protein